MQYKERAKTILMELCYAFFGKITFDVFSHDILTNETVETMVFNFTNETEIKIIIRIIIFDRFIVCWIVWRLRNVMRYRETM